MVEFTRSFEVISELGYPPSEFPKLLGERALVGKVESDEPDANLDAGDVCEVVVGGRRGIVTVVSKGMLSHDAYLKNLRAYGVRVEPVEFPALRDRRLVFRTRPKPARNPDGNDQQL